MAAGLAAVGLGWPERAGGFGLWGFFLLPAAPPPPPQALPLLLRALL